jgi:hypothetical protein
MNRRKHISTWALASALMACPLAVVAQQSYVASPQQTYAQHFFAHNAAMAALQPTMPTPLVEADPRLVQYYRFSFAHQYAPAGTETVNFGNSRGGGIIAWNRMEFDFCPPGYLQHNSTAMDGFGDTTLQTKYRIVSGNADHGNFIVTALLAHTFATGSAKNGALTDTWVPTLAGGAGFLRHFDAETTLGGTMPTGKIATQGRSIAWNSLVHDHLTPHIWLELENNATYYFAASHDGQMQNFVTPAVFYFYRRKEWKPTHPFLVFTGGMQIATSGFHTYNHNLISEVRYLF